MTDYTRVCPICDSELVEHCDQSDDYKCNRCQSVWDVSSCHTDYVVWQDNSETLTTRNLNDPYNYYRFHRC